MNRRHFSVCVKSGNRIIVSAKEFTISDNCITFLFGESGIGKSVISKAVYGLLSPDEFSVVINGAPYISHCFDNWTRAIQRNSFFVFQEPSSHLNPLMKISDQLDEGTLRQSKSDKILKELWQVTDRITLSSIIDIYPKPYRPSGGEKQRVLLAMAFKKIDILICTKSELEPTFFVFDEPTGSLDDNHRNLFLHTLLQRYIKRPFTILIITHDYSIISYIYRYWANLLNVIEFKELARIDGNEVEMYDFRVDEYMGWLKRFKTESNFCPQNEEVVKLNSNIRVFGRSINIYRDKERTSISNLIIRKGEIAYLKAPSGTGKTTIAKIILGLIRPDEFSMKLCGIDFNQDTPTKLWQSNVWGKLASMVFQHADEALNLQATVKETFSGLPLVPRLSSQKIKSVLKLLLENELSDSFLNKKVLSLSGGQKQRLNLLRTLILETCLIILDEPLNGLDFKSIQKVLTLLMQKLTQGSAILMISHNEEIFDAIVPSENIYYLADTNGTR